MTNVTIKQVRAYTVRGGGADYHDQPEGHWIDGQISTPMSKYPEYRMNRRSFGLNVLAPWWWRWKPVMAPWASR